MKWGKHNHLSLETARLTFMTRVNKLDNGCWLWTGAIGSHGRYGILGLAGKNWLAHRASWFLFNGEHPKKKLVCHKCDNGFCVNPKHLFLGTQKDNMVDMENKNRSLHPSGEKHGRAKLMLCDVVEMRRLHAEGMPIRAIAREFPIVSRSTVISAVKGKTWITK